MTILAYIALIGWIPAAVCLFAVMPARRAAASSLIGAWLLLPPYTLAISGLPDYSKNTAATAGIMLGTLIFDPVRLMSFRPRWFDLPMLLFCLSGICSSLQNGLGLYDGLADALNQSVTWGLPYVIGRLYFSDLEGLRIFAIAMPIGSLFYVPLCLFEMRMMMSLLVKLYGLGHWGGQSGLRLGGYRPNVFFYTGLELGMWMTAASLAGLWLWRCGVIKRIGQIPFGPVLLPILLGTTILCRSTGALALLAFGMMTLWLSARFRTRLLLASLLLVGPLYVAVRVTNLWSGQQAVDLAKRIVSPVRAESLAFRFRCENLLSVRAMEQPVFGWGGWGRSSVYFEEDRRPEHKVPTDGLWIILLGIKGYVGLVLFYLALILPAALFVWRIPARLWGEPRMAAGSLAAVLLGLHMVDCLVNAFPNIMYLALAGGLIGLKPPQLQARRDGVSDRARGGIPRMTASGALVARPGMCDGQILLADQYRDLGRSFKQEGRRDEAASAWRQALDVLTGLMEAKPDSSELRRLWCDCANDLAWLQANHSDLGRRDANTAVAMARRMVETYPDAEVYWNTLGVAYYRAGDYTAAVAALDHAITLGGGTAFDDIFLAMAHARLGNLKEARRELAQAVIRAEHDYPGHLELTGFCNEARFILTESSGAAVAAH